MQSLIVCFLFWFAISVSASNGGWMKPGGSTAYWEKAACEAAESVECFDFKTCPGDECGVADVDDLSQPRFLEAQSLACSGRSECQEALASLVCSLGSGLIDADYTKVYCAVPNGFGKKKALVVDGSKRAAKLAARSAEATEATAKGSKRNNLRRDLKDCIQTMRASPTATEQRACVLVLLRNAAIDDLNSSEL